MEIAGKVAVITGAGSGIGRAVAVELAHRGDDALAVGHIGGRKDPNTRGMLVAFSAMRFPALALLLAHAAPRGRQFTPVILAYVLCTFALVTVYEAVTARRRKRGEHPPVPAVQQRRVPAAGRA